MEHVITIQTDLTHIALLVSHFHSQGETIYSPVAIEVSNDSSPFDRGQVVVMLSRSPRADLIYIVGERETALERLWKTLCKKTCWDNYIEEILTQWSISGDEDGELATNHPSVGTQMIDIEHNYPYKLCNVTLPNSESGFVYMIVSTVDLDRCYVGETQNITLRMVKHNSGNGSKGSAPIEFLPYAPAAFLTNMAHLTRKQRKSLEKEWQRMNSYSIQQGLGDLESRIENGRRVMISYNQTASPENRIRMVRCIHKVSVD